MYSTKKHISKLMRVCVLSRFSHVRLFVTPWIAACQASLSMGILQASNWSGLPFPSPGMFPMQGSNPRLLCLLHWQAGSSLLVFTFLALLSCFRRFKEHLFLHDGTLVRWSECKHLWFMNPETLCVTTGHVHSKAVDAPLSSSELILTSPLWILLFQS